MTVDTYYRRKSLPEVNIHISPKNLELKRLQSINAFKVIDSPYAAIGATYLRIHTKSNQRASKKKNFLLRHCFANEKDPQAYPNLDGQNSLCELKLGTRSLPVANEP